MCQCYQVVRHQSPLTQWTVVPVVVAIPVGYEQEEPGFVKKTVCRTSSKERLTFI